MTHELSTEERRTIFLAMAHMAWADGRIDVVEVAALRAAATRLALLDPELGIVGLLSRGPDALPPLALSGMTIQTRALAVASAAWVALADRRSSRAEDVVLDRIAQRAGLTRAQAEELSMLAWQVRLLRPEELGWQEEFDVLLRALAELSGEDRATAPS
jgi:uncharacterized tellurite resistance protein B-like protein